MTFDYSLTSLIRGIDLDSLLYIKIFSDFLLIGSAV